MNHREQITHFEREVDALVTRFCMEYRLSTAAAIGVLQLAIHKIMVHATRDDSDSDTVVTDGT